MLEATFGAVGGPLARSSGRHHQGKGGQHSQRNAALAQQASQLKALKGCDVEHCSRLRRLERSGGLAADKLWDGRVAGLLNPDGLAEQVLAPGVFRAAMPSPSESGCHRGGGAFRRQQSKTWTARDPRSDDVDAPAAMQCRGLTQAAFTAGSVEGEKACDLDQRLHTDKALLGEAMGNGLHAANLFEDRAIDQVQIQKAKRANRIPTVCSRWTQTSCTQASRSSRCAVLCSRTPFKKKLLRRWVADASNAEDIFASFIDSDRADDDFNNTQATTSRTSRSTHSVHTRWRPSGLHAQVRGRQSLLARHRQGQQRVRTRLRKTCNEAVRCWRAWIGSDGSEDSVSRQAAMETSSVFYVVRVVHTADLAVPNEAQPFHAMIRRFLEGGLREVWNGCFEEVQDSKFWRHRVQAFVRRRGGEIDVAPKLRFSADAVETATLENLRLIVNAARTTLSTWQPLMRHGSTLPLQMAMAEVTIRWVDTVIGDEQVTLQIAKEHDDFLDIL